ncbi:HAMP domain-containing histidine kinase [Paenibacillus lemnae]|uniref:histidine kinase n=1 Tax=Paenibacillus lemnae TaxID=1330551 RepID=A0A848M1I2_PAELE|nr:HAMP domain-containing histidine kinase [Paenibacillus lemnae]
MLRSLAALFRRMHVLLLTAFFLFSLLFILLISVFYNIHWDSMFSDYHEQMIRNQGYKLLDDMRERGIADRQLTDEEEQWLDRITRLYGVLVRYADNRGQVLYDSVDLETRNSLPTVEEVPYIIDGQQHGVIQLAYLEASKELSPAMVDFRETLDSRSKSLFVLMLLLSLSISYLLAVMLTKHLKRLDQYAQSIRLGKWGGGIPEKGPEEIRRLAVTLREISSELQKQEAWRKNLMEDITHELRTPITSLMTKLEAIMDGVYEASEERLEKMYEELERLSRLLSDLQRLSEAEGAQFGLRMKKKDILKLCRKACMNFQILAAKNGIKLTYDPDNTPCYADIDQDKMLQVVTNLLSNAIKYTPPGGEVTLRASCRAEEVFIECSDNGIGISPEDLPYIFNRLYRADKSRSRFTGGVGLGLSIAKALVEAHEGKIYVDSTPGQGTVFTVRIPVQYRAG